MEVRKIVRERKKDFRFIWSIAPISLSLKSYFSCVFFLHSHTSIPIHSLIFSLFPLFFSLSLSQTIAFYFYHVEKGIVWTSLFASIFLVILCNAVCNMWFSNIHLTTHFYINLIFFSFFFLLCVFIIRGVNFKFLFVYDHVLVVWCTRENTNNVFIW
jgi:hypothetical protein